MTVETTTIIAVVHEGGQTAHAGEIWGKLNQLLFEVVDGPHVGKRGPSDDIYNLVGPVSWDKSQVSVYETDDRLEGGSW